MKDNIKNEMKQHEIEEISEQEESQLLEDIKEMVHYFFWGAAFLFVLGIISYYFG